MGIGIIISLVMHFRNLSKQTETAVRYPAVSSLFKIGRFRTVLVRMECSHEFREGIHLCEIYIREGQGNYESPFQDKDILSFYFYFCNSIPHENMNGTAPYRSKAVTWCFLYHSIQKT